MAQCMPSRIPPPVPTLQRFFVLTSFSLRTSIQRALGDTSDREGGRKRTSGAKKVLGEHSYGGREKHNDNMHTCEKVKEICKPCEKKNAPSPGCLAAPVCCVLNPLLERIGTYSIKSNDPHLAARMAAQARRQRGQTRIVHPMNCIRVCTYGRCVANGSHYR